MGDALAKYLDCEAVTSQVTFKDSKILGLSWRVQDDSFVFEVDLPSFEKYVKQTPTKRQLLSLVMSIFDPLGLVAFAILSPKLLLRELWRRTVASNC